VTNRSIGVKIDSMDGDDDVLGCFLDFDLLEGEKIEKIEKIEKRRKEKKRKEKKRDTPLLHRDAGELSLNGGCWWA